MSLATLAPAGSDSAPAYGIAPAALAVMLGALAVQGWAPWSRPWVLLLAFGVLPRLMTGAPKSATAALTALAFSVTLHAGAQGWMITALLRETGLPTPLALLATIASLLCQAGFIAAPLYLHARLRRSAPSAHGVPRRLVDVAQLAALLTVGEWARDALLGGNSIAMAYA